MKNRVNLYEDNAGGLHLHRVGDEVIYCDVGFSGASFAEDAQALLDGDAADWEIETLPLEVAEVLRETDLIATYYDEHVSVMTGYHSGVINAGSAGREYIGEDGVYVASRMAPLADAAEATGYSQDNLRRICRDHGPEGTGRVRAEKRHGKLWYIYAPDIEALVEAGVLRGPQGEEGR